MGQRDLHHVFKTFTYIFRNNTVKNWLILIVFGIQNYKDI